MAKTGAGSRSDTPPATSPRSPTWRPPSSGIKEHFALYGEYPLKSECPSSDYPTVGVVLPSFRDDGGPATRTRSRHRPVACRQSGAVVSGRCGPEGDLVSQPDHAGMVGQETQALVQLALVAFRPGQPIMLDAITEDIE